MSVKTYREVKQHATCCVTKSSRSSLHLLSDRVVNGRVSGSETRVIDNHPYRKVDFRGILNHEMNTTPLATTGGSTLTISSEVMLIMY